MIHWFIKRWRRSALLLGMSALVLAFVLLNTAFSTQSSEQAEDFDSRMCEAYEEVFSAVNPAAPADVYIQWDMPKSVTSKEQYNSVHSDWFLGAYKSDPGRLFVALDRTVLTNDVVYDVHYFSSGDAYLYVDLLNVYGEVVVENLYDNLTTDSDADMVLSLDVPLASYPDAAVIQLRCGDSNTAVYESRIYFEMEESRLTAVQEFYNSESEHNKGANDSGAVSRIYPDAVRTATSHDNLKEEEQFNQTRDGAATTSISKAGIIFVDQTIGDDRFTGRSQVVCGQDGPKQSIRSGLTAADEADTLVIKSGAYNENIDIKGKDVKVVVEGNVRL